MKSRNPPFRIGQAFRLMLLCSQIRFKRLPQLAIRELEEFQKSLAAE